MSANVLKSNKRIIAVFIIGLGLGALVGYAIPYLLPENIVTTVRVYDRLKELGIDYNNGYWSQHYYYEPVAVFIYDSLEEFWETYESGEGYFNFSNDQIYIDPLYNIIWWEHHEGGRYFLGVCVYSLPD